MSLSKFPVVTPPESREAAIPSDCLVYGLRQMLLMTSDKLLNSDLAVPQVESIVEAVINELEPR